MAKFQPGQSGNPSGKAKGLKDKRTALRAMLQPHAQNLMDTAVRLALGGDTTALRICMDRLVAPIREEHIKVTIPKINSPDDCTTAQANVLNAVAAGEMLPSEGQVLAGLIDGLRRAFETSELSKRVAVIEEQF
ncbi:MAG: DUF5681 domain-containing protein, partial [Burkholderiales bacterium]